MDKELLDHIDRACQLAELINDPTCNVELRPSELRQLLNERTEMLEALKAVEWVFDYDKQKSICPWCEAESRWGGFDVGETGIHKPNCLRQAAIDKAEGFSSTVEPRRA